MAAALAACGGGGGGGGPVNPPVTPTPNVTPTPPATFTASSSSTTTASIPATGGYSGVVTIPTGSGTGTMSDSLTNPAGTPILNVVHNRKRESTGSTALLYMSITATTAISLNGVPGFTINVPSTVSGSAYLAVLQGGVWTTTAGPFTILNGKITFPQSAGSVTIPAGQTVYLALYQGVVVPTPAPSASLNPYGCVGSAPYARARKPEVAHPIAAGDSFTYTGTIAQTFTQSAPCPQPTATSNATVGVSVVATPTTMPDAGGAGTDLKSTETDSYATSTQQTVTDQSVQNTASAYLLYETKASDANGNSIDTVYSSPHELDQLPETASSWGLSGSSYVNSPAGTVHETFADGSAATRTIASDGSYTDSQTFPNNVTWTITVNGAIDSQTANGSGVYFGLHSGTTYSYAAPSGGNIVLSINNGAVTRTFPAWFTLPVVPYVTDSFVDSGSSSIDSSCSNPISSTGNKIIETQTTLDPVVGFKETRTITSYNVDGYGSVCVKIDDTLNSYYDYNADTVAYSYQSQNGQPNSVNEIVEVLNMTSPVTPYPSVRTASAARQAHGVTPLAIAQHLATIDLQREVQRNQMIRTFVDHVLAGKGAQK